MLFFSESCFEDLKRNPCHTYDEEEQNFDNLNIQNTYQMLNFIGGIETFGYSPFRGNAP